MAYLRTFSSLGCPELGLEQMTALAARFGLPGVEVRAAGGTVDLPAHLEKTYGRPEKFAAAVAAMPARILALDTSLRLADGTAQQREEFLKFLPWAESAGVRRLRVFDGGHPGEAASLRSMAEAVAWWREQRSRHGWRADLMVETHDALFTAAAILEFERLAPGTGILWDTHHTWKVGKEDPATTWAAIKPHVVHLHVKDSVSIPSGKHAFTYRLPGEGEFPMAALQAAIAGQYAGPVSLEWERLWHPELAPLEEALRAAEKSKWY